jgi:hypothetical protein
MKTRILTSILLGLTSSALLADPILTPPPAPTLTAAAKQARLLVRVQSLTRSGYAQLKRLQSDGVTLIWHNPDGLTPQQACDALGASAAKLFGYHGTLTTALAAMQQADGIPIDVALPTNAFTVNPDGTVTVLPGPYVP